MQTACTTSPTVTKAPASVAAVVPRVATSTRIPAPVVANKPSVSNAKNSRQIQTWIPENNK